MSSDHLSAREDTDGSPDLPLMDSVTISLLRRDSRSVNPRGTRKMALRQTAFVKPQDACTPVRSRKHKLDASSPAALETPISRDSFKSVSFAPNVGNEYMRNIVSRGIQRIGTPAQTRAMMEEEMNEIRRRLKALVSLGSLNLQPEDSISVSDAGTPTTGLASPYGGGAGGIYAERDGAQSRLDLRAPVTQNLRRNALGLFRPPLGTTTRGARSRTNPELSRKVGGTVHQSFTSSILDIKPSTRTLQTPIKSRNVTRPRPNRVMTLPAQHIKASNTQTYPSRRFEGQRIANASMIQRDLQEALRKEKAQTKVPMKFGTPSGSNSAGNTPHVSNRAGRKAMKSVLNTPTRQARKVRGSRAMGTALGGSPVKKR